VGQSVISRSRFAVLVLISAVLVLALACGGEAATPTTKPVPTQTGAAPTATTAAAQPTATAAPAPTKAAAAQVPAPKNPVGTLVLGRAVLTCNVGLHTTPCEQYSANAWGIGEDLFSWAWKDQAAGVIDYTVPTLAVKWELAPDLSTVTIETRTGVKFHKGWGEMTATDVAWAYDQVNPAITPHSIAASASYFTALFGSNKAVVIDSNHVRFKFNKFQSNWNTYMMNMHGFVGLNVTSKKAYDDKGEDWAKDNYIGTGPFQVDSWTRDDNAVFSRFDEHWKYKPKLSKVIIRAIPENATRIAALRTGEIDAGDIGLKDVPPLLASGFVKRSTGDVSTTSIIFSGNLWETKNAATGEDLNTAKSPVYINPIPWIGNPFNEKWGSPPAGMTSMDRAKAVRTAVALAIDREAISKTIFADVAWPVYINYLDSKNPNSKAEWQYPYDPDKANKLLDDAGYKKSGSGVRFEMPLFVQTGYLGGIGAEVGDALSGMMAKVGIQTEIQKYPYAIYRPGLVARTATIPRYQQGDDGRGIFPFDWPKGIEASSLSRGGYCICFETPMMTETYLKVANEPDEKKRIELNTVMHQHLFDWALMPGVVAVPQTTVVNPKSVKNWVFQPTPFGTNAFWDVEPASR